eukprot:1140064-Pelagomonas_calceolata.AAC.1
MDACQNERLLKQRIEVPENISRAILTGFSLITLTPLPGPKAALTLSLCAPSQADTHTLILPRSFLKTGHSSC